MEQHLAGGGRGGQAGSPPGGQPRPGAMQGGTGGRRGSLCQADPHHLPPALTPALPDQLLPGGESAGVPSPRPLHLSPVWPATSSAAPTAATGAGVAAAADASAAACPPSSPANHRGCKAAVGGGVAVLAASCFLPSAATSCPAAPSTLTCAAATAATTAQQLPPPGLLLTPRPPVSPHLKHTATTPSTSHPDTPTNRSSAAAGDKPSCSSRCRADNASDPVSAPALAWQLLPHSMQLKKTEILPFQTKPAVACELLLRWGAASVVWRQHLVVVGGYGGMGAHSRLADVLLYDPHTPTPQPMPTAADTPPYL
ncbi:hypothetical protein V8C86DRAFT_767484 [Haematococcus lacustris]